MYNKIFSNLLLKIKIGFFLLLFAHLSIAEESKYIISNITINESAESASKAQEIANINANREAFLRLLKKLSINESFSDYIDDDQLEEAIYAKTISNEKIADSWYKATFNIEFTKGYIDNLLESKDFGLDLDLSKKYLIFPIQILDSQSKIWHNNNTWFNAWRSVLSENESEVIKIPAGDIDDISLLKSFDLETIKYLDIKDIVKKYNSKVAVFIDIYIDHLENNVAINITMVKKFTKKNIRLSFVNINDIKKESLYNIIVQRIIEYLSEKDLSEVEKQYKKKDSNNIYIDILPSSLKSWITFEKKLKKVNNLDFKVISVSADLIKLSIKPLEGVDILKYLEDYGVFVEKSEDSAIYYIALD